MSLATTIQILVNNTLTKSGDLIAASASSSVRQTNTLTNGTGAGKANLLLTKTGTLAAETTLAIDIDAALTDIYGTSIAMLKVKAIFVKNTSDLLSTPTPAVLYFGGGSDQLGTNAFDDFITAATPNGSEMLKIPAGGAVLISTPGDGYAVTAGTADIIGIYNTHATLQAQYELVVIGATA